MKSTLTADAPAAVRSRDKGFILVPVLFTLALLTLVAMIVSRTVATGVKENANLLHQAEAESLSDGIARLTIRYLAASAADLSRIGAFRLDGTPVSCVGGGGIAAISVNATAGQIDLNAASVEVLEALFTHLGADNPKGLAAAVIDFRDFDNEVSPGGAEAAEYQAAGLRHGPKNAPFQTVGELDQVLGMTPALLERARPLLTTHSRLVAPDPTVASPEVLALSPGTELANRSDTRSLLVRVTVRMTDRSHAVYTREAGVRVEPRLPGGFLLRDWLSSTTPVDGAGNDDDGSLPACLGLLSPANG